jgi:hypothetical protein
MALFLLPAVLHPGKLYQLRWRHAVADAAQPELTHLVIRFYRVIGGDVVGIRVEVAIRAVLVKGIYLTTERG